MTKKELLPLIGKDVILITNDGKICGKFMLIDRDDTGSCLAVIKLYKPAHKYAPAGVAYPINICFIKTVEDLKCG